MQTSLQIYIEKRKEVISQTFLCMIDQKNGVDKVLRGLRVLKNVVVRQ